MPRRCRTRCPAAAAVRAVHRLGVERLGRRRIEHALPAQSRWPQPRRTCAAADPEVGLRLPVRQLGLRPAERRRRPRVRRQPTPASSTRSTPPPAASTGRSGPGPASAPRRRSAPATARTGSSPTSATSRAAVYAVDAETGDEVWTARVDTHPVARVTGAPKLAAGRLFVPMSSLEESGAGNPSYPCCTFRGGVAAYDAKTGARLWKNFTVADEPRRDQAHVGRHPAVGAGRRRGMVVADRRPGAARRLSRHRQRLHRAGRHRLRRGDRLRPRHRQAPVGASR